MKQRLKGSKRLLTPELDSFKTDLKTFVFRKALEYQRALRGENAAVALFAKF